MYCRQAYSGEMSEPRSDRLQLRVSPQQRAVIQRAAETAHETLTDYVVRHAVSAAKNDLADRRFFAVDDIAWGEFMALLDRPPAQKPKLERLFSETELWDN